MHQTDTYRHALMIAHCIKRYQETLTQLHAAQSKITDMQNNELHYVKQLSQTPESTINDVQQFHKQLELDIDYDISKRLEEFLHIELLSIQTKIVDLNLQNEHLDPIVKQFFTVIKEPETYGYDVAKVVQDELHQALTAIRNQTLTTPVK